jgi:hypothetical protein
MPPARWYISTAISWKKTSADPGTMQKNNGVGGKGTTRRSAKLQRWISHKDLSVQIAQRFLSGPCSPVPVTTHQQESKMGHHQTFARLPFSALWNMGTSYMTSGMAARCILSHVLFWTAEFGGNKRAERKKNLVLLFRWIHLSLHHHSHNGNTRSSGTLEASPRKENTKRKRI